MKIVDLSTTDPETLSPWEREQCYNGYDITITRNVFDGLVTQLDEHTAATYAFSKALQAPTMEMRTRGVLVDQARKAEVIDEYFAKIETLEANLERIVLDGVGMPYFNWRSSADLKRLFYDELGIPPIRKAGRPTTDRNAREKLEAYPVAQSIAKHINAISDLAKKISVLKTEIDADGRIRTSYNIAGTSTGRFSSSFSEFGTGCVRPDAEALTPQGWKLIAEINSGDVIAQYNEGQIEFVTCKMYEEDFDGNLIAFATEQSGLAVTPGHRVLFWDAYHGWITDHAQNVRTRHQIRIPLGGHHNGNLSFPAYLPMLMADFSKEPYYWRGEFKRQRKIDRFLELAKLHNFDFEEQKAREGFRRFAVRASQSLPKKWGPWVLELTSKNAEELIEEARYWDATDRGSGYIFYTADPVQAEWFATLAHLAGRSATIRRVEQHEKSWSDTVMWWVNVKARDYAQVLRKHWYTIPYTGKVYCPIVPSSFWLVRENNKISVTGNTNLQNIEESLRSILIADTGYKFAKFDAKSGESFVVGAIEWNLFADDAYLNDCESGDIHTSAARSCWPELGWTGDIKKDKNIAEQLFYRHYTYRFMCKKLGHGSSYGGRAETLSTQAKVPIGLVRNFQDAYFKAYPAHRDWQEAVKSELKLRGYLISLMGRKRWFFGRRNDHSTEREAIAYDPQSSLADIVNRAMLRIWRRNIAIVSMHDHDALTFMYPEKDEDTVIPLLQQALPETIPLNNGRTLTIPYDCKVGFNKGDWDKDRNPDGLKDYTGHDERKRTPKMGILDRIIS